MAALYMGSIKKQGMKGMLPSSAPVQAPEVPTTLHGVAGWL